MKKKILLMAIALMSIGITNTAMAQKQETGTASASAYIINPIAINKTVDMSFGNIAIGTGVGTVLIAPSSEGGLTIGGDAFIPATGGSSAAAKFTISGENSYTYTITIPTGDHTITHTNTTDVMIVNNFTSSIGTGAGDGFLDASNGNQVLYVGATLNISGDQLTGSYASLTAFDVKVNYN